MIRKLLKTDRSKLIELINEIDLFTNEEIAVAIELIDESINNPNQDYYNIFVYEEEENIIGYHCIGKRALTDRVYDLYWIVVNPKYQSKGIGKSLLLHSEEFVKQNNGRMILVETSSKENYKHTRNFYIKNNYEEIAQIKDFYSLGDNLIIFRKIIKI